MYSKYLEHINAAKQSLAKSSTPMKPTPSDIEGPYYVPGAPVAQVYLVLCPDPTLQISGQVFDTAGKLLSGATVDIWQADAAGVYDNSGTTFGFRGKIQTDDQACWRLNTVEPGDYQIGPNEFRCAHIHAKVWAPGYQMLTTQLYFNGDKYNATDHWFNQAMVVGDGTGTFSFDFVLERV